MDSKTWPTVMHARSYIRTRTCFKQISVAAVGGESYAWRTLLYAGLAAEWLASKAFHPHWCFPPVLSKFGPPLVPTHRPAARTPPPATASGYDHKLLAGFFFNVHFYPSTRQRKPGIFLIIDPPLRSFSECSSSRFSCRR